MINCLSIQLMMIIFIHLIGSVGWNKAFTKLNNQLKKAKPLHKKLNNLLETKKNKQIINQK
jgi:hypothetical protein